MKDPTRQGRTRKRLLSKVHRALLRARNEVDFIIGGLTVNFLATEYDETPQGIEQMQLNIEAIINMALLGSIAGTVAFNDWEFAPEVDQAYRAATGETVNETNRLIQAAAIAGAYKLLIAPRQISIEEVLFSAEYQKLSRQSKIKVFHTFKSFSAKTSADINRAISDGMRAGKRRSEIIDDVKDRFKVAKSSAKRIVNTEINKAHNDGRIDSARLLEKKTGQKVKVRHMSALIPTTRPEHSARHNKIYAMDEQLAWWDSGSNRINCYCSIRTVLVDKKGGIINI